MPPRDDSNLPTLPQLVVSAFVILMIIGIAIVFMDTWNKSVTPTLSPEAQKQTQDAQDRFWFSVYIIGAAGIIIVIAVILRLFGYIQFNEFLCCLKFKIHKIEVL